MKIILMIMLGISLIHAEFIDTGDTVKDTLSGLEWQDGFIDSTMTWENAITHCENLSLNGLGWRLPNVGELKSIRDKSSYRRMLPVFKIMTDKNYWSSTTSAGYKDDAWTIRYGYENYIGSGGNGIYHKNTQDYVYVRCVRYIQ